jgi:hypothetical protein
MVSFRLGGTPVIAGSEGAPRLERVRALGGGLPQSDDRSGGRRGTGSRPPDSGPDGLLDQSGVAA